MVLTCDKYFEIIRKNFFHEIIVLLYNIGAYTICFADWLYLGIMSRGYKIIQKRDKCISSKKSWKHITFILLLWMWYHRNDFQNELGKMKEKLKINKNLSGQKI